MSRRSTKGKHGAPSYLRTRQAQPDVPPLFFSDPEKNFSQWVQNCFPDAELAREDAIRQWLTSPLEARVQNGRKNGADCVKSSGPQTPASPPQQSANSLSSNKASAKNLTGRSGWNSNLGGAAEKDRRAGHFASAGRDASKLLLKFAKCTVMALLIVIIVRATPTGNGTSQANNPIPPNEPSSAGSAQIPIVPVPQADKPIATEPDFALGPFTIENLSIECENTQPCVRISTRGKGSVPRLSRLANPDRVVMDFPNAVLSFNIHRIEVWHGGVKDVRVAQNTVQSPYTRVVIDLTEKCDYELRMVTNGVLLKVFPAAALHQTS